MSKTALSNNEDRVKEATPASINEKIENDTWTRVGSYTKRTPDEVSARIDEVDKEWDIERYLGVNMSTLALAGLAVAALSRNKNWNLLPAVVLAFFFQHSIQGWCPPLPILRHFKKRTSEEIEQEKYALKVIRGDFNDVASREHQEIEKLKQAIIKT